MVVFIGRDELKIDPLLSIETVAKWLNVHPNTVRNMITSGELVSYKVRAARKISTASVVAYLESQKSG